MSKKSFDEIFLKNANYLFNNTKTIKILLKNDKKCVFDKYNLIENHFVLKDFDDKNENKKEVSWTDEQKETIFSRDKNLLVSASAGSGKTTVMTQRIIELIKDEKLPRTEITDFLVVTFTSASASDMKSKIIDKLCSLPKSDFILKQIDNVAISDISDLHSFYSRLISTYFYEINLDPNFSIVDAIQSELLKQRAITRVFERAEKEDAESYFRLFDIIQRHRTDDDLKTVIFAMSNFFASIIDADKWFNEKLEAIYDENVETNFSAIAFKNYLYEFAQNSICDINEFLKLCPGCQIYNEYFQNLIISLSMFSKEKSLKDNLKILFNIEFSRFNRPKDDFVIFHEQGASLKDNLKKNIESFKNDIITDDVNILSSYIKNAKQDIILLYKFTKQFDEEYNELKKSIGVLDFNDLEKYALKILENPSICQTIKNKYKYIFVDEYQDINEVQEKIISLISSSNNRFMVGDIKQSIYGFRLCDPEIFLSKYYEYEKETKNNQVIKLNCNFRSDRNILRFVDDVCSKFMTERFGGINYARDSIFVPGEPNSNEQGSVNLCYIDTGKEQQEYISNQVYSVKNHQNQNQNLSKGKLEARLVAQKISEIIHAKNLKSEKIKLSDFAILYFTKSKTVTEFIDEFKKQGFSVAIDKNGNLVQKNYIQEILNFVKLCVNIKDDYNLFKVLKSKLFNFNDNEIVKIRLLNQTIPFFEVIYEFEKLDDSNLKEKIREFFEKINYYQKLAKIMDIKDFCKNIIKDFKLEKLNLVNPDGQYYNEDIHIFLSNLPEESVVGFINNYSDFSIEGSTSEDENSVNVMTVHKSKGMEFKYVFIINTSGKLSYQSAHSTVLTDKKYMFGINYYDCKTRTKKQTLPMLMCKLAIKKKLAEEQLRVFYVALTRAKSKLFVICSKDKNSLSDSPKNLPTNYSNWIEFLILHKLDGTMSQKYDYINFESFERTDFEDDFKAQKFDLILQKQDVSLPEKFEYKYFESTNIPLKNSVSKILKNTDTNLEENDFDDEYEKQQEDFSKEFLISSANRGTAYHKFFENVDFDSLDFDNIQLDDILLKLTEEEKSFINLCTCKKILSNPIFKEISTMKVFKEREFFAEIPANLVDRNAIDSDTVMMQGVIDLFAVGDKEIYVLDYKTGKISDEKLAKYSFQLNMYSKICEEAFSLPVTKKILCFIDEQKIIKI